MRARMRSAFRSRRSLELFWGECRAFSRLDLIGCLVAAGFVVLAGLPMLAGFQAGGDRQQCGSNHRQLLRAWALYAEDSEGALARNLDGGELVGLRTTNFAWALGWLDYTRFRNDNTNTALLMDARLGGYLDSAVVFRCPADTSTSSPAGGQPRVRSVAMSGYVGTAFPYSSGYRNFLKMSQLMDPSPSACFVFTDQREDSINDPVFQVDMTGFDVGDASAHVLVEHPAARHEGGATLGFADGHTEVWRWIDKRTTPPMRIGQALPMGARTPRNPDVVRLQSAATRRNP